MTNTTPTAPVHASIQHDTAAPREMTHSLGHNVAILTLDGFTKAEDVTTGTLRTVTMVKVNPATFHRATVTLRTWTHNATCQAVAK